MTNAMPSGSKTGEKPGRGETALCVDLDGTLIKTDLLHESFVKLLSNSPLNAFRALAYLASGIPAFKSHIAENVEIRADLLPYREEVLQYVRAEREAGRRTVLVTASHERFAEAVAKHLALFDEVHATTKDRNLKGTTKAKFLTESFACFEYIGDSSADIPVWKAASRVGVINTNRSISRKAHSIDPEAKSYEGGFELRTIPKMLRVHQWVKNLLLFVPLVMAHSLMDVQLFGTVLLAFFLFSLTASSVYILNDLVDLDNDRVHPTKRNRPLASGALSPQRAFFWIVGLLGFVACALSFLPIQFGVTLFIYYLLTTAYSFVLKKVAILDVVTLASLYTIRIIAGGAASGIPVSEWLLAFSLFMFFSLACVKRFSELLSMRERNIGATQGRGYLAEDIEQVAIFGSVSGYISVLVLALYINSPAVVELYGSPRALWLLCVTVLYWVTRVWLLTRRGEMHEDPIVFALHDKVSYLVLLISVSIILLAL